MKTPTNMQRRPEHVAVTVAPVAGQSVPGDVQSVPGDVLMVILAHALQGRHIDTETTFTISGDGAVVATNSRGVVLLAPAVK
ncbi:MAG: hypothetical protein AAF787_17965 [Chloroflexota bacterium]